MRNAVKELATHSELPELPMGYAIKRIAKPVRITPKVKALLIEMFDDGVKNRRKMTPIQAVERIMTEKWAGSGGKLKFDRAERIETKHVQRYWSGLKSARERKLLSEVDEGDAEVLDPDAEMMVEEDEHEMHDDPMFETIQDVITRAMSEIGMVIEL